MKDLESSKDPFATETLQTTVENELRALGWIEGVTEDIRGRIFWAINTLKKDSIISQEETGDNLVMQKLERVCGAVMNRLYNQPQLNHREFAKLNITRPLQEGLPETLYPAVYIQLFEQSGIPVLEYLRQSFAVLERPGQRGGKKYLLEALRGQLTEAALPTSLQESLLESLDKFLSRETGKNRLGMLLFSGDQEKLEAWKKVFPTQNKADQIKSEADELPTPKVAAELFLSGKFNYFAGNPVSTPGIVTAFRNSVKSLIGASQAPFLTVEIKGGSFLIKLGGTHNVDRKILEQFKETVETNWKNKFPFGEDLIIYLETNNNGGNDGAFVDI